MSNLVFSLNATVPVFLIIVVGYLLKKKGILNKKFVKPANKFNYTVTLPALLFSDLIKSDFKAAYDQKFVLYCMAATTFSFLLVWAFAKMSLKIKRDVAEFVQASFRSSAAVLGISFIQNINGDTSIGMAPLMILAAVPLYNVYSVIVLNFEAEISGENNYKKAFKEILTNPIIISIFLGMIASMINLKLPIIVETSLNNLAKIATPLALICIGAGFEGKRAISKIKPVIAASIIKLIIIPAIFFPFAIYMGFTGDKLIAIMVMLSAPTTPSAYIMAKNTGYEGVLTTGAVVLTTLTSAFTITAIIYIIKSMGLI